MMAHSLQCNVMPDHSRLYHLEPIGVGTPGVESLTSYLTRLAEAHSVKLGHLVDQEIIPQSKIEYSSVTFFERAHTFNAASSVTIKFIEALEEATLRRDLKNLSILFWRDVLSDYKLLRHNLAWCPLCYHQWEQNGDILYQPLIWYFEDIKFCPNHLRALVDICPVCNKKLPILSRISIPGYCSRCGAWLGAEDNPVSDFIEEQLDWMDWSASCLGELFIYTPFQDDYISKDTLQDNISFAIEYFTNGSIKKFSKKTGMNAKALSSWRQHYRIPGITNLIRFSYCTNINIGDLLLRHLSNDDLEACELRNSGFISSNSPKAFDYDLVKDKLEKVLKLNGKPISVSQIARDLGYNVLTIQKHFPDLYQHLVDKYQIEAKRYYSEKADKRLKEIRKTTIDLCNQGIYPSIEKVKSQLPSNYFIFKQDSFDTWKATIQELSRENRLIA